MSSRQFRFLQFFLGFGIGLTLLHCQKSPQPETTLASFAGQEIKLEEFQKVFAQRKENYSLSTLRDSTLSLKIKQQVLSELIDQKLLLQAALQQGVSVEAAELDYELEKYKSKYSELSFQKMLSEKGYSADSWKQMKKENLLISKFVDSYAKPQISEEELRRYYQQHPEEFHQGERVHIRQIVTDTKEKAELILRRLQNGENFAKLAKELSLSPDRREGGDLGFISKGTFPREFEVCFAMNPGEVSSIIPSTYGFHIFKVLEKAEAKELGFEDVRFKIESRLKQESKSKWVQDLLVKLRAEAKLTINEDVLKRISL